MLTCPNCGKEMSLEDLREVCPNCGVPVPPEFEDAPDVEKKPGEREAEGN